MYDPYIRWSTPTFNTEFNSCISGTGFVGASSAKRIQYSAFLPNYGLLACEASRRHSALTLVVADALSPPHCISTLFPTIKFSVRELGTTNLALQNSCLIILVSMTHVI